MSISFTGSDLFFFYNTSTLGKNTKYHGNIRKNKEYEKKKPDALLVDRRNKSKPVVIAVIEHKSPDEFKTKKQKKEAVEQCNQLCSSSKSKDRNCNRQIKIYLV